jgi:hypothetical protein
MARMSAETILSILTLGALGAVLPWWLMRFQPDTQRGLVVALALSVVLLTFIGAGLFIWLYAGDVAPSALLSPAALLHFWTLGVRAALIWLPVLGLTALALAQGIERRRGERMAARDPD